MRQGNGGPRAAVIDRRAGAQAAVSHIDVSNALLISGMFMPKLLFAALLLALLVAGLSATLGATSAARSLSLIHISEPTRPY